MPLSSSLSSPAALSALASAFLLLACAEDPQGASPQNEAGAGASSGGAAGSPGLAGAAGAVGAVQGGGTAGASGGGAGGKVCAEPPGSSRAPTSCVREVRGLLADEAGLPLPDRTVTLCGIVCFPGKTDADGRFVIPVDVKLPAGGYVVMGHGRPDRATVITRLPDVVDGLVTLAEPMRLPLLPASSFLPADGAPAQAIASGPLSLGVPEGTSWDLDVEDFALSEGPRPFSSVRVTGASVPSFAAGSPLVFALGPFQARPSKPIAIDIADAGGLAPGQAVDFVVMDDGVYFAENTGGLPRVVAKGHVSAEGTHVRTDEGEGIDVLTWLSVRAAAP